MLSRSAKTSWIEIEYKNTIGNRCEKSRSAKTSWIEILEGLELTESETSRSAKTSWIEMDTALNTSKMADSRGLRRPRGLKLREEGYRPEDHRVEVCEDLVD